MNRGDKWRRVFAGAFFAAAGGSACWLAYASPDSAAAVRTDSLFPRAIAISLIVLGIVAGARDFRIDTGTAVAWRLRPFLLVTGSVIAFAAVIGRGGLLPAIFASVVISALGSRDARLGQSVALGVCVAGIVALLFVGLLGQPMKLIAGWP